MKRIPGSLALIVLGLAVGWFIAHERGGETVESAHVIAPDYLAKFNADGKRLLSIPGTKNFRDLGGYKTTDGRSVKWNMVYRSDNLAHLDHAGMQALKALGINAITDLRSEPERLQEPDRIPADFPGATYQVLPINDRPVDIRVLGRKIITGDIAADEILDLLDHRRFITNASHRDYWGAWLADLANDDATPHLFHCTSGKDRTGFGAAIFLLSLGVPKQTVQEDFLLSNAVLEDYNTAQIADIDKRVPGKIDEELFRKILGVSQETIEATFAQMEASYGSVDGFIRDGLGIDDAKREQLKSKFLE